KFGILIINMDMHIVLGALNPLHDPQGALYVLNDNGDFLVHPDANRTFGFDQNRPHRWQDEFPSVASLAGISSTEVRPFRNSAGHKVFAAAAATQLASGPRIVAIEVAPESTLLAPARSIRRAAIYAGLAAVIGALILALVIARSLSKPLARMANAVQSFAREESLDVPVEASGEIGILARTFARMVDDVSDKTAALRAEIEERRRAEYELAQHAERERLFIAVVESSEDAIIAMTLDGVITAWNPAAERLFGYTAHEAIGREISIIAPENRSDEPLALLDRIWRGERIDQFETVRVTKDGRQLDVVLSASPVRSPSNEIIGASKIIHDITERKQAEERFRLVLESSPNCIVVLDRAGCIQFVNAATEQTFGYTREEIAGQHIERLLPQLSSDEELPTDAVTIDGDAEHLGHRKNGTTFPVEFALRPLVTPTGPQVLCTIVDITQRKLNEQERDQLAARLRRSEKMEAVGQLAGGVAHDFNNILTAILGNADLARGLINRPEQVDHAALADYLQQIEKSATSAADLTRQLLAFGSRQAAQPRPLNLNDRVAGMQKMLRRLIPENIQLEYPESPDLPAIMADPSQIEQILVNLVVNARDAMPDGGTILIETTTATIDESATHLDPDVEPGNYVLLTVSDTGTGMDEATQARLFEPFFTTKQRGQGTGLGLATVYGIVKQAEGHIHVYSEIGHGSTFRVYFPAIAATVPEPETPAPAPAPEGSGTILLCEDDESVRLLMEQLIAGAGYTVITAGNGEEALNLAKAQRRPIDLLVTDVVMPGMHGRALAEKLRALRPALKVLYVSGYTANVIAHHGLIENEIELIEKPFTRAALLQRIHHILHATSTPTPANP
ncbi:MAG TPA: PAS domain S-box protein, partial [Phycisphaerae bacterium]|nr:PAS domain S-box protein [Phycisphaerae bacterium]